MFVDTQEAAKVSSNQYALVISYLRAIRELIGDERRHCRFKVCEYEDREFTKPVKWCLMGAADHVHINRTVVARHCDETIILHPEIFGGYASFDKYMSKCVNVNNSAPHYITMRMLDLTIERLERA